MVGGKWIFTNYLATIPDRYPLPHVQDILIQELSCCTIFSRVNLVRAYHQILIADEDVYKPHPLALLNSGECPLVSKLQPKPSSSSSMALTTVLLMLIISSMPVRMSFIYSTFQRLEDFGIIVNPDKCLFGKSSLTRLHHLHVGNRPRPVTQQQLCEFLGMVNFYRRFMSNCSQPMHPLNTILQSTRKGCPFRLTGPLLQFLPSSKSRQPPPKLLFWFIHTQMLPSASPLMLQKQQYGYCYSNMWTDTGNPKHSSPKVAPTRKEEQCIQQRTPCCLPRYQTFSPFSNIRHISGNHNLAADTLSRVTINTNLPRDSVIDYKHLSAEQNTDTTLLGLQGQQIISTSRKSRYPTQVFSACHNISHPSIRATQQKHLVKSKVIWPNINKDLRDWSKPAAPAKGTRPTRSALQSFSVPDRRLQHIHLALVGPLPMYNGCSYILTAVDRFSRWPVAFPFPDITAATGARGIVAGWAYRQRDSRFASFAYKPLVSRPLVKREKDCEGLHPFVKSRCRFVSKVAAVMLVAADRKEY
ncbi:uncharacterized protein LOC122260442 [Penaeus japonicus]|uniref:uncharacterized protein LOC122260442 n=1 Tax=Penaeus japonicus TaxID=27405 RepID=UPI001C717B66|nr:uncharacterized protein LOC122260442 [Penaeus japonicus]